MTRFEYELWGARATALRGVALPHAKLDDDKVSLIRGDYSKTAKQWAAIFGVSERCIERVRGRETWTHVRG